MGYEDKVCGDVFPHIYHATYLLRTLSLEVYVLYLFGLLHDLDWAAGSLSRTGNQSLQVR